jgi:hypothetical protein
MGESHLYSVYMLLHLLICADVTILTFVERSQLDYNVRSFFNVLLNLICKYFIEDFCIIFINVIEPIVFVCLYSVLVSG